MKSIYSVLMLLCSYALCSAQATTNLKGHLEICQIVQLANAKTISSISSIAMSNGYKLAYKKNGAYGYDGYNVTDIAWVYKPLLFLLWMGGSILIVFL